ncbi:MAG: PKD domain-containing protein [Chitinispirillaceae bacterium]
MRQSTFFLFSLLFVRMAMAEMTITELDVYPHRQIVFQFDDDLIINSVKWRDYDGAEEHEIVRVDENGVVHTLAEISLDEPAYNIESVYKYNGLYYIMQQTPGYPSILGLKPCDIWVSDGSEGNYVKILDGPVVEAILYDDDFYYMRPTIDPNAAHWHEVPKKLYRYDIETGVETHIPLFDNEPDWYSPAPTKFEVFQDKLFFTACIPTYGFEPLLYDGNEVTIIADVDPGEGSGFLEDFDDGYIYPNGDHARVQAVGYRSAVTDDRVYFPVFMRPYGVELYSTDGTEEGTNFLGDHCENASPYYLESYDDVFAPIYAALEDKIIYVWGEGGEYGSELFVSDGTSEGTHMITDLHPGEAEIELEHHEIATYNGHVYFRAHSELWRTDGTEEGTQEFFSLPQQQGCDPWNLVPASDGYLYFFAVVTENVTECTPEGCLPAQQYRAAIFRTDGTTSGTEELCRDRITDGSAEALRYDRSLKVTSGGIFFTSERNGYEVLCRFHEDGAPQIVTEPVIQGRTGETYEYLIEATDPENNPIFFTADDLPDWLSLTDNENGSALLSGTPDLVGDYPVEITASTEFNTPATQNFTIHVTEGVRPEQVRAFMLDEALLSNNSFLSVPRIYIINEGTDALTDFSMEYYFRVESGKIPSASPYYLPFGSISVQDLGNDLYKIVYTISGVQLQAGEVFPDQSGCAIGIHNSDWSEIDITDDYSNNQSSTFAENDHICVYGSNGQLLWGVPPSGDNIAPVADAGEDITVYDPMQDGETITLDGSNSMDPDGSIATYEWLINGTVVAEGVSPQITFQVGLTTVTLRVTDFEGGVGYDEVNVLVQGQPQDLVFTIEPNPVPQDEPVVVEYSIPENMNGCLIEFILQREWDMLNFREDQNFFSSTTGDHRLEIWDWNKSFFGGSGPWNINIYINDQLLETQTIQFNY